MKKLSDKQYYLALGGVLVLAIFAILYGQYIQQQNQAFFPKPLTKDDMEKYSNTDPNAVVIYPIFTQSAYKDDGFYPPKGETKYPYNLSVKLDQKINGSYTEGINGYKYLKQLNYYTITDIDVDKNPEILKKYDKVILLHNEYVTQKEFDAIKNHPHVLYLYPNALYGKISVDYDSMTITIMRGHGYPDKSILNGFGYVTTSNHEYDLRCDNYKWETRPNGIQPTCWPEFVVQSDRGMLEAIKDFPAKLPSNMIYPVNQTIDVSNIKQCDWFGCK